MEGRRLENNFKYLGGKVNYKVFECFRLVTSVIIFGLVLIFFKYGFILAPICALIYYFLIYYLIIEKSIKLREAELEVDALEYFPIFLLSLKDGRNVKKAISVSTEIVDNNLSKEFKKVLNDVEIGKSLQEVLSLMQERIPSETIKTIIGFMIEANRVGTNIEDSVNTQLKYISLKRRNKIINRCKSTPLMMAIASIVFVLIIILILILFKVFS